MIVKIEYKGNTLCKMVIAVSFYTMSSIYPSYKHLWRKIPKVKFIWNGEGMPAMHTLYNFLKLVELLQVIVVRPGKLISVREVSLFLHIYTYTVLHMNSANKDLYGTNEIWIDHKKKPWEKSLAFFYTYQILIFFYNQLHWIRETRCAGLFEKGRGE
jgi:hypothetical protein